MWRKFDKFDGMEDICQTTIFIISRYVLTRFMGIQTDGKY